MDHSDPVVGFCIGGFLEAHFGLGGGFGWFVLEWVNGVYWVRVIGFVGLNGT